MTAEAATDDEHRCGAERTRGIRHRYQRFTDGEWLVDAGTMAGKLDDDDGMSVSL